MFWMFGECLFLVDSRMSDRGSSSLRCPLPFYLLWLLGNYDSPLKPSVIRVYPQCKTTKRRCSHNKNQDDIDDDEIRREKENEQINKTQITPSTSSPERKGLWHTTKTENKQHRKEPHRLDKEKRHKRKKKGSVSYWQRVKVHHQNQKHPP